jgi:DNA-binding NarL/FixJ family response regulator
MERKADISSPGGNTTITRATSQLAEADAIILAALLAMKRGLDLHQSAATMLRAACCSHGALDGAGPETAAAQLTAMRLEPPFARWFSQPQAALLSGPDNGLLTCREKQVLLLVTQGLANRGIARSLGIAEKTVKNHLAAVFAKLRVADRTQAALYAVQAGMTDPVFAAPQTGS